MLRKRRQTAPHFRQLQPFNPLTGQFAKIGVGSEITRVAMMQVSEADTHDNFVVCRGFDPESGKFLNSVNVAKPYGVRGTNPYVVGQVFAAAKPKTVLGDTPGVAATTVGHPADLTETVEILTDDSGNPVAWTILGDGGREAISLFELTADLEPGGSATAYPVVWDEEAVPAGYVADTGADTITVYDVLECFRAKTGAWGFAWQGPDSENYQIVYVEHDILTPRILYDDVAPGDSDKLAWPCASDMTADTAADKVTIQNTFPGHFRGYGDAHTGFDATTAAKVWTTIGTDGKEYIVHGKGQAKLISGTLGGALTTTTASQTISSPVSMDGGQVPSGTVTGYNVYTTAGFEGDSGGRCVAAWNEGTDHYEFIDVECPA